jgi:lysophospholipase L1-like esterase
MRITATVPVVVLLGMLCPLVHADDKTEFPLKDGDIWVMAGDSITAQHMHSNYFEAYCFAHYPKIKFAFRNSGVSGHTIPATLGRFDYDIAAWKPTVVSVELGMNDQNGTATDKFVENMGTMVKRIREIKARPVIFSASPINNGNTTKDLGGNKRLNEYADALKEFAAGEKLPYADQFHALIDVWGKNKARELLANTTANLQQMAKDDNLPGVEHLREFLAVQDKLPKPVSMQGDPVHPGAPGQLMMAAALLKYLGADGFVSSATLDAHGKVAGSKDCKIDNVTAENGKIAFDRTDERVPFPIHDDARAVLALDPTILALSEYTLKVTGLKEGKYNITIDGMPLATVTAKELDAGINLTSLAAAQQPQKVHPIVAQSRAILNAVNAKETIVGQWRNLSQRAHATNAAPELKDQLNDMTKKVEEADQKIREAAQPKKMHFEIAPAA